jgi:ferredoxin
MEWNDLYIISTILGLAVLVVGVRAMAQFGRSFINTDNPSVEREISPKAQADAGIENSLDNETARQLTVTFRESGKQFPWDPAMSCLLDFIESKDIQVECLCGAGECGSCRTRLLEGEVTYRQKPKINPGDGYCLLCVTVPKSDLVLAR